MSHLKGSAICQFFLSPSFQSFCFISKFSLLLTSMNKSIGQEKEHFLITGTSSGLGLALALEALRRGHQVTGTARDIKRASSTSPQFEAAGGTWMELDLTHGDVQDRVRDTVKSQGVTVLINNAGYGIYGALEDMSESEIRAQMETNFFGTIKVIKGCVPEFRARRRGVIVTMSSVSGLTLSMPSGIMYSASKFSLEAIAEGLALQLAPFGIRSLLVEPGMFKTNWLSGSYVTPAAGLSKEYKGTPLDEWLLRYPEMDGDQPGDPKKAAQVIVSVVTGTDGGADAKVKQCLRLPLGNDAMDRARMYVKSLSEELDAMELMARSTDFEC